MSDGISDMMIEHESKKTGISNIEFDGVNVFDAPDFCDAFICSADKDGRPITNDELDELNKDRDFVLTELYNYLF